jgi:hypothetical protein
MSIESEYEALVLADSPVIYLPMNDSTGATSVTNLGSYAVNPTMIGGTFTSGANIFGTALNTSYDNLNPSTYPNLDGNAGWTLPASGFTIEFAIKASSLSGGIFTSYPAGLGGGFLIWAYGSYLQFGTLNAGSWNTLQSTAPVINGASNHVVCVWDGTNRKIYVNGVLNITDTPSQGYGYSTAAPLNFTTNADIQRYPLTNAAIGHVALYPSVLSDATITAHYNKFNEAPPPEGGPLPPTGYTERTPSSIKITLADMKTAKRYDEPRPNFKVTGQVFPRNTK